MSSIDIQKVNIFGRKYIADYILSTWNREQREFSYQIYISSVLKGIAGAEVGWYELIESLKETPSKESAEEIKVRLTDKFNNMVE